MDGLVKIWDQKKQLLRELQFPEAINYAIFLNSKGDILVSHLNNVTCVLAKDFVNFDISSLQVDDPESVGYLAGKKTLATDEMLAKMKKHDDRLKFMPGSKEYPESSDEELSGTSRPLTTS